MVLGNLPYFLLFLFFFSLFLFACASSRPAPFSPSSPSRPSFLSSFLPPYRLLPPGFSVLLLRSLGATFVLSVFASFVDFPPLLPLLSLSLSLCCVFIVASSFLLSLSFSFLFFRLALASCALFLLCSGPLSFFSPGLRPRGCFPPTDVGIFYVRPCAPADARPIRSALDC